MSLLLSYITPVFTRADLLRVTVNSLCAQDEVRTLPWEWLIVDDGSTDDLQAVLESARSRGLPVRCLRIDQAKYPEGTWKSDDGQNNPAVALNVGIRAAKAPRVVLSSPEILHLRAGNLARLCHWDIPEKTALVCDVWDESMRIFIGGGTQLRPLHFLCAYHKADLEAVGGFEEQFMEGRAFEDTEFVQRWLRSGRRFEGSGPAILAQHPAHSRPEYEGDDRFQGPYLHNRKIAMQLLSNPAHWQANQGRPWGDVARYVESEWPSPN